MNVYNSVSFVNLDNKVTKEEVPTFNDILNKRAKNVNKEKQRVREAKYAIMRAQVVKYFSDTPFFKDIHLCVENLCNIVLNAANKGEYSCRLCRIYDKYSDNYEYKNDPHKPIGMNEIADVHKYVYNNSEWSDIRDELKEHFRKWVDLNVSKLVVLFKERTMCKIDHEVLDDKFIISINWDK